MTWTVLQDLVVERILFVLARITFVKKTMIEEATMLSLRYHSKRQWIMIQMMNDGHR